jgi:hypothetical protein
MGFQAHFERSRVDSCGGCGKSRALNRSRNWIFSGGTSSGLTELTDTSTNSKVVDWHGRMGEKAEMHRQCIFTGDAHPHGYSGLFVGGNMYGSMAEISGWRPRGSQLRFLPFRRFSHPNAVYVESRIFKQEYLLQSFH